jgi:hypothetical protein
VRDVIAFLITTFQAPDGSETCSRRWTDGIMRDGLLTQISAIMIASYQIVT